MGPKKYINLFHNNRDVGKLLVASDFAEEWETIKTGEKCYISHCYSPSDFYIQLESDTNNLELISEYLNSNIERFPIMDTFTVDAICSVTIFDVEMYAPGETITVNLYDNGINIFKTLEPLCQKHNIESMTESIVDEIFTSNDYMLNGYEGVIAHINSPNDFLFIMKMFSQ